MLRRKVEKDIMHWIESSEKALLVYDNVKVRERITYYPIYMVMFLQDSLVDFMDISIDKFMM